MESRELVKAWAAPWPGGASAAVVSALDVLAGDVLEDETGERPASAIVQLDGVDAGAIASWSAGWPEKAGVLERILRRKQKALLRRLVADRASAADRVAAWRRTESALGEIPWSTVADMEVVSLAMGHFGPARQPVALPVIASFLAGVAATFAGASVERIALAVPAASSVLQYEPAFTAIARTSHRAIEELARRARERGHDIADPFARPITTYLPLLGGTLV